MSFVVTASVRFHTFVNWLGGVPPKMFMIGVSPQRFTYIYIYIYSPKDNGDRAIGMLTIQRTLLCNWSTDYSTLATSTCSWKTCVRCCSNYKTIQSSIAVTHQSVCSLLANMNAASRWLTIPPWLCCCRYFHVSCNCRCKSALISRWLRCDPWWNSCRLPLTRPQSLI